MKKKSKIEKQAAFEFNIVKGCRQNYFEKLQETQNTIDKLKILQTILLEKGKNSDESEINISQKGRTLSEITKKYLSKTDFTREPPAESVASSLSVFEESPNIDCNLDTTESFLPNVVDEFFGTN